MSSLTRWSIFLVPIIGLAACQTTQKSVSLKEAKSITANFVGKSVETPPRGIEDLMATLASYDEEPDPQIAKHRANANKTISPEVEADPKRLMNFLFKRMLARQNIGMGQEALDDARRALPLVRKYNKSTKPESDYSRGGMLTNIAWQELEFGLFSEAIEISEEALATNAPPSWTYSQMTRFLVWQGKLDEAEIMLSRTKKARAEKRNDHHVPRLLAMIAQSKGEWAEAEAQFRKAQSALRTRGGEEWAKRSMVFNARRIAKTVRKQGRLSESELILRNELNSLLKRTQTSKTETVTVLLNDLSDNFQAAGRFEDSITLAHKVQEILSEINYPQASWITAGTYRTEATGYLALRQFDKAREVFDEQQRIYETVAPLAYEKWSKQNINRLLTYVLTDPKPADLVVIEDIYTTALKRLGAKHYKTAEFAALKATYLSKTGKTAEARVLFEDAFKILNARSRRTSNGGESNVLKRLRTIFLMEAYLDLLSEEIIRAEGPAKDALIALAYKIAATARGQMVAESMSASAVRASFDNPELQELARREQDAQRQIQALYALLADATSKGTSKDELTPLRTSIDNLRAARAALFEQIESEFPDYASLINPKAQGPDKLSDKLTQDEAVVSFYFTGSKALVFMARKDQPTRFVEVAITKKELASYVARLRDALEPNAETLGDIPSFDMEASHALYQKLLAPLSNDLAGVKDLYVIPHSDLWQIPLGVLTTAAYELPEDKEVLFESYQNAPWLARDYAIAVLPSANVLINQRSITKPVTERLQLAAFGDPYFSPAQQSAALEGTTDNLVSRGLVSSGVFQSRGLKLKRRAAPVTRASSSASLADLPRLPDTLQEVESIALALKADISRDLFTGINATEANAKTQDLSNRRFLVFATHGLVPGDLDGLNQPALALTSPAITGTGEDGLLTTSEILGLRLNADLVVLSACNTASADGAGSEAVSGLGAAFFYAGAKTMLVSGWPVETTSARQLTTTLFENFDKVKDASPMSALQQSNLNLIKNGGYRDENGDMLFSYSHPIFWAPFMVIGDSGKGATLPAS
ncbi:CHAT domain-containing protein [Kiloniella sp.]|uniref:CHAT domain-containing protein n=1 Tax=Kiloniella sp. TaxID=1938587 RepID=UPI003B0156A0